MRNILVTGAAGFIGSNFVQYFTSKYPDYNIIVLDKLTYAGNIHNLDPVKDKIKFIQGDICDRSLVEKIFKEEEINGVIHFAAESHVDNSIKTPFIFTETNVLGTHVLLDTAKNIWGEGSENKFVHISTDEVFGTLEQIPEDLAEKIAKDQVKTILEMSEEDRHKYYFYENRQIAPNSPYSASKAGSDMIARAYFETFKMNVNITNCSNNYGPYQHKEKLIPNTIKLALEDKKVPVYGTGANVRDWLYVLDHCKAIDMVFHNAKAGERYCIGGHNEMHNIDIVKLILNHLGKTEDLIEFVTDRKGHDLRYAIDPTKIGNDLGWKPETRFSEGIIQTIDWYLEHREWLA
ncbi:dTDP-glucose 4,6-dehydratase [Candidatus Saccharibacteria bacterium]|nr:dTDP-glucose 4,6-dehydratase [Candidatus Saccharibacteria bacterium]